MKKSLIALAVLAAAGAASAQSGNLNGIPAAGSVQIFGVVDATWQHGSGSVASKTRLGNSGLNSSRLGLRGTEDLGGGMSASFWLEAGVNNDDGTGSASNNNNQAAAAALGNGQQGLTFNRQSWVSLNGGWGSVRLGRDYTPQFVNLTTYDPFGTNGVGTTLTNAAAGAGTPTFVRASNSIAYLTPSNLGGFNGTLQYYMGENASNAAGGTNKDGTGYGLKVGYAAGPLDVGVAVSNTKYAAGDQKVWNIGGQWNFGVATLQAQYNRDRIDGVAGAANSTANSWLIGGLVPVGAGLIRASYSTIKTNAGAGTSPRARQLALGYVHNLSKRTALYATVARVTNSNGSAIALNGSTTGVNQHSTGYDIGLRHSF
ncbi:porin [Ramlibacter humi]|uniref:Porin n=1 Tax=Ramlibacter humi TaxID=2530451 RepID=A0A4Z0BYG2_9BURK|nr:porin [Ramlibacter humi]TFZ03554.1 porin [Ramlibacter humi]